MSSISQQIAGTLEAEWALGGTLAVANMRFSVGWYDSRNNMFPQVTVRKAWSPEPRWFMDSPADGIATLGYLAFNKYFVDSWLYVDRDVLGESEYETVEDMMFECFRILNVKREDFTAPLGLVIPLDQGEAMHETQVQPYILHIQMLAQANVRSGTC